MNQAGERSERSVETDRLYETVPKRLGAFAAEATLSMRKHLGLGLASAGLTLPAAAGFGIMTAHAEDTIGANQTEYSTNVQSAIELDLGPLGRAYLPDPVPVLGLTATVEGIPINNSKDFFSNATLDEYRETYENAGPYIKRIEHKLIDDAIWKGLAAEAVAGSALLGAIKNRKQLAKPSKWLVKPAVAVVAAGTLIAPFAVDHAKGQTPNEERYTIPQLDHTPLAGTETNSQLLKELFVTVLPKWLELQKQEAADRQAYITSIDGQLDKAAASICQPAPDEKVILVVSDTHSSKTSVVIQKKIIDLCQPVLTINSGDITDNGLTSEDAGVKAEVDTMQDHSHYVTILGNHDSVETGKAIKAAGGTLLDGKTITIDGIKLLGYSDPVENYAYSSSRFERSDSGPQTEEALGKAEYEVAEKTEPDIIVDHEPDPVKTFVNTAGTKSIPTQLILNGHMHVVDGPYVLPNDDGTYTVQYQSGTTGGKKALSADQYWTEDSTPGVDATWALFYLNKDTNQPMAYQQLTATPDERLLVGDKTPFETPQSTAGASVPGSESNNQAGGDVTQQHRK